MCAALILLVLFKERKNMIVWDSGRSWSASWRSSGLQIVRARNKAISLLSILEPRASFVHSGSCFSRRSVTLFCLEARASQVRSSIPLEQLQEAKRALPRFLSYSRWADHQHDTFSDLGYCFSFHLARATLRPHCPALCEHMYLSNHMLIY